MIWIKQLTRNLPPMPWSQGHLPPNERVSGWRTLFSNLMAAFCTWLIKEIQELWPGAAIIGIFLLLWWITP